MFVALIVAFVIAAPAVAQEWPQWGAHPEHGSNVPYIGQSLNQNIVDIQYDPLIDQEMAETLALGDEPLLLAHLQVPLIDGDDVYMMYKSGQYNVRNYQSQQWGESKYTWNASHTALNEVWRFDSDWNAIGGLFTNWENVFQPALANGSLYVPGKGGSVWRVNKTTGVGIRINPFAVPGGGLKANLDVISPISVDAEGNIYYSAIQFDNDISIYAHDIKGAWLVKISPSNAITVADWATLTAGAPAGTAQCANQFSNAQLPWPPSPDAVAPTITCGTQRSGLNVAPAIAPDGTIYLASRAHFNSYESFLVAVNPDLTQKWMVSLRERFNDGCGVPYALGGTLPPNGAPGGCRAGANYGVDPATNRPGGGRVQDNGTSSPVVAPDGTVYYGSFTRYNYAQGHMVRFSAGGSYLGSYPFGWDITPGIWEHDGTYSVITKENRYPLGSYCNNEAVCPSDNSGRVNPEAYLVTQFNTTLRADALADRGDKLFTVEWSYQNTNTKACARDANGNITCAEDPVHPNSYEFCVNAFAIDGNGTVYGTSEDGWLYKIEQGGIVNTVPGCGTTTTNCGGKIFQQLTLGAAYTPTAIDGAGRIYSQNAGHLFVSGN
ncbi:MAG TPA: hypothetical protein VEU30_16240 [Thermoanaerobaculia bacterium]|nr:hypothetical protein [Thermoanaerobaculia bacterium]